MALTYATLTQALEDFTQAGSEATFVSNIPVFIRQAEDRILKAVVLPVFQKNSTATMTAGNKYLLTPTDFLAPFHLIAIVSGVYNYLLEKDSNFLQEAYPDPTVTGVPRYYTVFDNTAFALAPTPASAYTAELQYYARPPSIVDAGTSWLGTNAENALLYACLVEAYTFLKGEEDLMKKYEGEYQAAMFDLKRLGQGFNNRDNFRSQEPRTPV